mmetsp:Transcript_19023/g.30969  ORF Transcript_19023/g.30969 Transcript_19023/m.30969 type:complete len:142 (-) Transcript_19023:303-728(-)
MLGEGRMIIFALGMKGLNWKGSGGTREFGIERSSSSDSESGRIAVVEIDRVILLGCLAGLKGRVEFVSRPLFRETDLKKSGKALELRFSSLCIVSGQDRERRRGTTGVSAEKMKFFDVEVRQMLNIASDSSSSSLRHSETL